MPLLIASGLDLETTGLNQPEHRIIEACVIRYEIDPADLSHRRELSAKSWRIDPQRSITPKAQEVHGITLADLSGKPTFDKVARQIRDELDAADLVVAHNGFGFDFDFLLREFDRVGCPHPDFLPFDTMIDGRWATPWGEVPSLGRLCFTCGVDYDPKKAHAAEYDVRVMMDCFFWGLHNERFKWPS